MANKRNPILPPSLSSVPSAPAPDESEWEREYRERANAQIKRENARRKQKRSGADAFVRLIARLWPETDVVAALRGANPDDVAAALMAEDHAQARSLLTPRKRGRPRTLRKHLRIMCSVEAYVGAGLKRTDALQRAAEQWTLALSTIDEIYRDKKFLKAKSAAIRDCFNGESLTEIDEAIRQFCEAERHGK